MSKQLYFANFKTKGSAERKTVDGVEYLVAPVTALVSGVLNGHYAPVEVFQNTAALFEGVPVPVGHPKKADGSFLSVNEDSSAVIGDFRNVKWEVDRLKGEVWINIAQAIEKDFAALVDQIEAGLHMEVSTAFWAEVADIPGSHKGKAYSGIWLNVAKADHLALLPNEQGACSGEDGCGLFGNSMLGRFWNRAVKTFSVNGLQANEMSDWDVREALAHAIASETQDHVFVMDVFSEAGLFIYEQQPDFAQPGPLYERGFTRNDDDSVTLAPERVEVERVVSYQPVTNQEVPTMTRKEHVSALIANKKAAEADRAHLEGLSDDAFAVLAKACGCTEEPAKGEGTETPAPVANAETPSLTAEGIAKIVKDTVSAELAANEAKKDEAERGELVGKLLANKSIGLSEDELKATPIAVLRRMAAPAPSFAGRGHPTPASNGGGEAYVMPSFLSKKPESKEAN